MKILVACEFSGVVRRAFRARGHDAFSCDLLPALDASPFHIQDDVLRVLAQGWDMMIAHPPCTYLCSSGLHWNNKVAGRKALTEDALNFVRALLSAPIGKIALENPVGCISTQIRTFNQIIQPYQFGHDASKTTCLWLKNLPALMPTKFIPASCFSPTGLPRWANQTPTGQNKLGPSKDRWAVRSITYQGIADAMAELW